MTDAADQLDAAWTALDAAPDGRAEKAAICRILREEPNLLTAARAAALCRLLSDPDIDPGHLSIAGWRHILRDTGILAAEGEAMAVALERSDLALTLLREDYVALFDAERPLTAVRRWLLLADRWRDFPRLSEALRAQAALNGGAWPFDAEERARLAGDATLAYLPLRPNVMDAAPFDHPVTRAVAAQYEGWPYPSWTRATAAPPRTLAQLVRKRDPDGPDTIPTPADILIAGCGSGRQTALTALNLPHDRIVSIDLSAASLAYARKRCGAAGLGGIDFRQLDLHDVAALGRQFDAIMCTGVLHHLPDPEKGWEALVRVLKPGGVMHVMVYSRLARMRVAALRKALGELTDRPVDDDLLREIRRRMLALPNRPASTSRDFYTLAGVHDLLVHRHEDPFDIPRIRRTLDRFGLELIRFELPRAAHTKAYRSANPRDTLQRDYDGWTRMERANPSLFAAMYDFWCRKPAATA